MSKTTTTTTTTQTSGSDEDLQSVTDQRKRKRMLSNRESARRSRTRKREHLDDLIKQVGQLQAENGRIAMQADMITQQYVVVEAGNNVLRAEVMGLMERLQLLNSVLRAVQEASMGIPETTMPWQMPIMASHDMFYC